MNRIENQQLDTISWNKLEKCQPMVPSLQYSHSTREKFTLWGWLPQMINRVLPEALEGTGVVGQAKDSDASWSKARRKANRRD